VISFRLECRNFNGDLRQIGDHFNKRGLAMMKSQFLLVGIVAIGLFASTPEGVAHGGGGGGGGGGHGGGAFHGGGGFHGGGRFGGFRGGRFGGFRGGRFGNFHGRGRFFGPGFGFYGYPWWWDWGYPYYPYYYPGPYYGYDAYYGNPYGGNPYGGNPYGGTSYYGNPYGGTSYYGNPNYRTGDARSSPTIAVQAALARRGYYRGPINGVLSPESRSAIRSFQARNGLPVTGRIDDDLVRALRS
jgi:hypothetical protein